MRTTRVTITTACLSPKLQPVPPGTDDPEAVEQLAREVIRLASRFEAALHRIEARYAETAPTSATYVAQLRSRVAISTLTWLTGWPKR